MPHGAHAHGTEPILAVLKQGITISVPIPADKKSGPVEKQIQKYQVSPASRPCHGEATKKIVMDAVQV